MIRFLSNLRRRACRPEGAFFRSTVRRYRRGVDAALLVRAAQLLRDCAGPDHGAAGLALDQAGVAPTWSSMPPASQLVLWAALAVPGVATVARQATGAISYGEAIHESGEWAVRLLAVVLAVTPLKLAFPRAGWTQWLLRRRRDLGVAVFGYAGLHLAVYLWRKAEAPALILREAMDAGMAVGWVAFVGFAVLAATSNDASVRRLGRRWKPLHRLVYAAAALTMAHWILTAFDPFVGWIYAAVLVAVEAARLALRRLRAG